MHINDDKEREEVESPERKRELLHRLTGQRVYLYSSDEIFARIHFTGILSYLGDGNYQVKSADNIVYFSANNVVEIDEQEIKILFF